MPIIDYEERARKSEVKLFANTNISEKTKRKLRQFLIAYNASAARRSIFIDKIRPIVEYFDDIEEALTDRDAINECFADLRQRYSPATYATYINVTCRFLSWMNDGERPNSVRDLRQRGVKLRNTRNLNPNDMITWKEGLRIAGVSPSIQTAAIGPTQLDCGFRPSEFVDLNYGDVKVNTGIAVIRVRGGKTGDRSVIARRCVPFLLRWLEAHPTKRAEDPLWVFEDSVQSDSAGRIHVRRYTYPAMRKRVRDLARRAGVHKPTDFYSLRHSSCVLDKLDNLPTEMAAERHGHSVKHFVSTYGRLSLEDNMHRFRLHYGLESEQSSKQVAHHVCPNCEAVNLEDAKWCSRCGQPIAAAVHEIAPVAQASEDTSQLRAELDQLRLELQDSRRREDQYRDDQMRLLRQMVEIKSAFTREAQLVKQYMP